MMKENPMRVSYVKADDLYEWVLATFSSFDGWRDFERENIALITLWEDERKFRIVEGAKSGLITEVIKGNASAVGQLKSLLGFVNPVGRPKGSYNVSDETKVAIEKKILDDYEQDSARMNCMSVTK